jgi:hypothetical protein
LNKDLKDLSIDLLEHYNNSVGIHTINVEWLKNFINPPQQAGTIPTKLSAYIDYFTLHKKSEIGSSTYKRNMKKKALNNEEKLLLRKRSVIETVNDELKNICQV